MTIVLSGPASFITQAKSALRAARFDVQDTEHDWGLNGTPEGHAYVTVIGDDIDKAWAAVDPLGWRLRSHWNNDPVETEHSALALSPAELSAVRELLKASK